MVSWKQGLTTNLILGIPLLITLSILAPLARFWYHFWSHQILNGGPQNDHFENILQKWEKGGPINGFEQIWFFDRFWMLKWEAWNGRIEVFALYMLQITRFRRSGDWSNKWCQKSSKKAPKASFGHPWIRFLRFWKDLIEVWFLMSFDAAKKMKLIWKKKGKVWKVNYPR